MNSSPPNSSNRFSGSLFIGAHHSIPEKVAPVTPLFPRFRKRRRTSTSSNSGMYHYLGGKKYYDNHQSSNDGEISGSQHIEGNAEAIAEPKRSRHTQTRTISVAEYEKSKAKWAAYVKGLKEKLIASHAANEKLKSQVVVLKQKIKGQESCTNDVLDDSLAKQRELMLRIASLQQQNVSLKVQLKQYNQYSNYNDNSKAMESQNSNNIPICSNVPIGFLTDPKKVVLENVPCLESEDLEYVKNAIKKYGAVNEIYSGTVEAEDFVRVEIEYVRKEDAAVALAGLQNLVIPYYDIDGKRCWTNPVIHVHLGMYRGRSIVDEEEKQGKDEGEANGDDWAETPELW